MAKFAILNGNQVTACIVADDKETALSVVPAGLDAVEYSEDNPAAVSWRYDKDTNTFIKPVIEEPVVEAPVVEEQVVIEPVLPRRLGDEGAINNAQL